MNCRCCRVCLALIVVALAYVAYILNANFQPFKPVHTHHDETCIYLSTPEGQIEDLTFTSEGLGIGSIDDKVKLNKDPSKAPQGGFVSISLDPFEYRPIKITGFPAEVDLHPHGVFLHRDKWLYAVNYAFNRGGQRVEVFELSKAPLELKYLRSVIFSAEYMGSLNDLVVLDEGTLYVSSFLPSPVDDKDPENHSFFGRLFWWTFFKTTEVLKCDVTTDLATCSSQLKGQQMNGITTDGTDVYINDLHAREITRLKIDSATKTLSVAEVIKVSAPIDNIEYNVATKRIYGGAMATLTKQMQFSYGEPKLPGTVVEVEWTLEGWKSNELMTLDGMHTVSSAPRWGDYVVVGTWHDTKIARCKLW